MTETEKKDLHSWWRQNEPGLEASESSEVQVSKLKELMLAAARRNSAFDHLSERDITTEAVIHLDGGRLVGGRIPEEIIAVNEAKIVWEAERVVREDAKMAILVARREAEALRTKDDVDGDAVVKVISK